MPKVDADNLLKRFGRYLKLERGLSTNTVEGYQCDVEKLVDFIQTENLDWSQVTGDDLHRFVCTLQDLGIGARSQARIISGIKSFFGFLKLEKLIENDPSELIESPKLGVKLPDVLTVDEVDRMVESFDLSQPEDRRNRAIIETLYGCGLRVSELVGLRISDLYLTDGYIIVEGKGEKRRLVPISQNAIREINLYLEDRRELDIKRGSEDILFLNRRGGEAYPGDGLLYCETGLRAVWHSQAGEPPHAASYLCHPPARGGGQPAGHSTDVGAREHHHHRDIYPPRQAVPAAGNLAISSPKPAESPQ